MHTNYKQMQSRSEKMSSKRTNPFLRKRQKESVNQETEFTDEERYRNEVASTAYKGSNTEDVNLQNDRLETGGF